MNIYELAEKIGGEVVGGHLIAVVDGKKQYVSEVGADGRPYLNALGLALENDLTPDVAPTVEEIATVTDTPKAKKVKSSTDVLDDVEVVAFIYRRCLSQISRHAGGREVDHIARDDRVRCGCGESHLVHAAHVAEVSDGAERARLPRRKRPSVEVARCHACGENAVIDVGRVDGKRVTVVILIHSAAGVWRTHYPQQASVVKL